MQVISAEHINGEIHIVRREPSNAMYSTNPPRPAPDKVWKEIYRVQDGEITLKETILGTHIPGGYQEESILFNQMK